MPILFIEVLLPLAVNNLFTYKVPEVFSGSIAVGKRVIVPFGKQKIYSALIRRIHTTYTDSIELKEIQSVLDDYPVVKEQQFAFWEWISTYYMCSQGEVMNAALPASLKLQSETRVSAIRDSEQGNMKLTENEEIILAALQERNEMSIDEIAKLLKKASVHQILKKAIEKNLILLSEEINLRYKPRKEAHLRLATAYLVESELEK